jgi:quercetin dioxygenase-like cupin family protein
MSDEPKAPARFEAGVSLSATRPARPLADPVLKFDFEEEAARLRREGPWLQHGRNAVTLVKHPDLRVVFMIMKPETRMQQHHTSGRILVHTLSGHVRLHLGEGLVDLPAGRLLALEHDIVHDVEAVAESAVLLTISWPGETSPR